MKSNYNPIGNYIRQVDKRNTGLKVTTLLGLSISKEFIPSVANIIGSDMENYKIIRKNQFACSLMQVRRDKKIPVALLQQFDEAIISQAYPVFEVIDEEILLPEYLMMWFSRSEFDREACFYAVGGVRGSLEWEDFCNMQLPVPPIEKQKEIVAEYNTIVNRIKLNEQLNRKLEETAQAIYKQWFVDFEFPDENGKPYKSNGGEMVRTDKVEFEIPAGWKAGQISQIVQTQYGYTTSARSEPGGPKFLRITDIAQPYIDWDSVPFCDIHYSEIDKYRLYDGDVVVARTGATVGYAKRINKLNPESIFASYLVRITPQKEQHKNFVGLTFIGKDFLDFIQNVAGGSGQPQASATLMTEYSTVIPEGVALESFNRFVEPIMNQAEVYQMQICRLKELQSLILSGLSYKERQN